MTLETAEAWNGAGELPLLYAKTSKGAVNTWACWANADHVWVRWGQEDGAQQTAHFKCEPKNEGRSNATTAEEQAIFEARAKWKKQVKKKYHWDRNHVLTQRNLKPMLAKDFKKEEKKVVYPVHVQPKFDGVRCLAYRKDGNVYLQSRGGDPYTVHHIQAQLGTCLPDGVILDGELYHHGTSLQTINSWVKKPKEESEALVFMVYDFHLDALPAAYWENRLVHLKQFFQRENMKELTHILEVQTEIAEGRGGVKHYHDSYVQLGYEGAIIRLPRGEYRFGYRSSELLKLKEFQDDEFEIVGWARGKGKFLNVPTFRCRMKNGAEFDCTPKGTEEERLQMLYDADSLIGQQLTVRFFDYTDDGIPHFPVGIAVRPPGT